MHERKPKPAPAPTVGSLIAQAIDAVVFAVAPIYGARRIATRRAFAAASLVYEAAESGRERGDKWLGSRLSPDSGLELDLDQARHRSRELYRNDSIGGAVDDRVNNVVGCGFKLQAKIAATEEDDDGPLIDKLRARKLNRQLERLFARTAERIDLTRTRSLWQLHRLQERAHAVDGESLTIISDVGDVDRPLPLTLEVVDVDRLETPPGETGNPRIRMGIEKDARGRIVAYHIRRKNPYDTRDVDLQYDRVDAKRVLHVFEQWFPGQSRGLPWMIRSLNRVKDVKDLDEAAVIAEQVRACYAAFVESAAGPERNAVGAGNGQITANGKREQDIQPGTIRYLDRGEKISFASPGGSGSNFSMFQELNYRRIAAGINEPYEMLAKNWNGLSFAGGRLVLTSYRLDVESRQQYTAELWLSPIYRRIVEEAVILGEVDIEAREFQDWQHEFQAHAFIPPAWRYALNPGEEVDADIAAVTANHKTLAEVIAANGGDYDEVLAQREREVADQETRGITPQANQPKVTAPPSKKPARTTAKPAEVAA